MVIKMPKKCSKYAGIVVTALTTHMYLLVFKATLNRRKLIRYIGYKHETFDGTIGSFHHYYSQTSSQFSRAHRN